MTKAQIDLISPHGTPIRLTVEPGTDTKEITDLIDRADAIGQHYVAHGWLFASSPPSTPGAAELAAGPTFAGYPCSPTTDDNGLPTWLIVNGKQAQRREKQGDVWYSVKLADGTYDRILTIPKGEQAPAVQGLDR